jgi:GT2 family glycosyltransferase
VNESAHLVPVVRARAIISPSVHALRRRGNRDSLFNVTSVPHESPGTLAYTTFLSEVVKERDFVIFRPWQRGAAESELAWKYRVVHQAAKRFQQEAVDVAADLERTLDERRTINERRYAARLPALLAHVFRRSRRLLIKGAILPLLRLKHIGFAGQGGRRAAPVTLEGVMPRRSGRIKPMASIVILSHSRLAYLRTTLAALHATTARDDYELIVVDNGSTDGSAEALRRLAACGAIDKLILQSENRGTSAGFNAGFAQADPSTRYLIKLDSDIVILTPGWLRAFDRFYARVPGLGLLALRQVNHLAHRLASTQRVAGEPVISWNDSVIGGACMTIPRALFDALGYFREDFGIKYMPDDIDYAARVALTGRRSFYLCRTMAYHRHDRDRHYAALETRKRVERVESKAQMARIRREYVVGQHSLYVPRPVPVSTATLVGR